MSCIFQKFEVKMFFSSLKIFIASSWETFGALLFLFSILFLVFFFSSNSLFWEWLRDFGDIWGENKLQIFFGWDGSDYTMNMKVGEVVGISAVNTYPGMDLCMPIFLGEASDKISQRNKIDLKRFQNSKRTHILTKLNTNKSWYVDNYLALVAM
jgi:hypothetical protein